MENFKMAFQKRAGNWVELRKEFGLSQEDEVDLHFGRRDNSVSSYEDVMADVEKLVEAKLAQAQKSGRRYLMFVHGYSTSRPGRTTARSKVRSFMRSSVATPFIERAQCIQHETVFVAKIKRAHKPA
jgi:hypothetical protein